MTIPFAPMTRTPSWFPLVGHAISAEDIRRPPRVVLALLIAMAVVMAVGWVLPAADHERLMLALGSHLFSNGVLQPAHAYSLFTSWLAHSDILHLLFNALWIVAFARAATAHLGALGFLAFFILTSAAGSFAGVAAHWGQPVTVVGASGAAFGLIGAGAYVLTQGSGVARKLGAMAGYVAVFMALNLGFAYVGGAAFGVEGSISWEAHAGGMAAGLVLFPIFAAWRAARTGPPDLS